MHLVTGPRFLNMLGAVWGAGDRAVNGNRGTIISLPREHRSSSGFHFYICASFPLALAAQGLRRKSWCPGVRNRERGDPRGAGGDSGSRRWSLPSVTLPQATVLPTPFPKVMTPDSGSETLRGFHFCCSVPVPPSQLCRFAHGFEHPGACSFLLLPFSSRSPDSLVMSFIT